VVAAGALAAAPALAVGDVDASPPPPPQEASTAQSEVDATMRPTQKSEKVEVMEKEEPK
jgi:hypothetical protein